jgi:hypothetical protein
MQVQTNKIEISYPRGCSRTVRKRGPNECEHGMNPNLAFPENMLEEGILRSIVNRHRMTSFHA